MKINVAILFGGKSAEHEVSIRSAKTIVEALDREKYNPILIKIEKSGQWFVDGKETFLAPGMNPLKIDVVFPVLHGPFGEDGTVQGLLKLANLPFVGAGVLGSAVGMDKDVMKRLFVQAKIPTPKFLVFKDTETVKFDEVSQKLGLPVFIKPANMGSSVGVSKVESREKFDAAIKSAFAYDTKIIIEEYVKGRELECSVLGNDYPQASLPGEIITNASHDFYTYEAKYLDENGASLVIPVHLPEDIIEQIKKTAVDAFKTLCCEGMARVDFFLRGDGELLVNEINTIPGFTSISMYPKLWEASGLGYGELVDKLIQLAIERFDKEQKLKIV